MWVKLYPQPRPPVIKPGVKLTYPLSPPKWHWSKEQINELASYNAHVACGLIISLALTSKSDIRDTKPKTALLCKKCKKAFDD